MNNHYLFRVVLILAIGFNSCFFFENAIAQGISEEQYIRIQKETFNNRNTKDFLKKALADFSDNKYLEIKPYVFEKDIPSIQKSIADRKLTYKELVQFYLYRIDRYENNESTSLHSILALNPTIIEEAIAKDKLAKGKAVRSAIFGMPILLKDNIGSENMSTTAGAISLKDNIVSDAVIVKNLKSNGALILGKVNMSEWAYYLCEDCPSGYSAVGGHTLNPYGPRKLDTGGSSSGSAVAVAANFAVAAVGTETCGSILSPSGQNAVVGLKPTVGLLSGTGIVPLSSTFDTPGPITKNIIDNAILLSAMKNAKDEKQQVVYNDELESSKLEGKKFGYISSFMSNPLYKQTLSQLKNAGATLVEINIDLSGIEGEDFLKILNYDFKYDLSNYLQQDASKKVAIKSFDDLIDFNNKEQRKDIPYGQQLLEKAKLDKSSQEKITLIKNNILSKGKNVLERLFKENQLDAILSINNYSALEAVLANYPALAVPMGFVEHSEPVALTFIAPSNQELLLLQLGAAYERLLPARIPPKGFD